VGHAIRVGANEIVVRAVFDGYAQALRPRQAPAGGTDSDIVSGHPVVDGCRARDVEAPSAEPLNYQSEYLVVGANEVHAQNEAAAGAVPSRHALRSGGVGSAAKGGLRPAVDGCAAGRIAKIWQSGKRLDDPHAGPGHKVPVAGGKIELDHVRPRVGVGI